MVDGVERSAHSAARKHDIPAKRPDAPFLVLEHAAPLGRQFLPRERRVADMEDHAVLPVDCQRIVAKAKREVVFQLLGGGLFPWLRLFGQLHLERRGRRFERRNCGNQY